MAKTAIIQARVEPEVKEKAQRIFEKLNITMSEAISIYLNQVAIHGGIPLDMHIPNALTEETLRKSEKNEDLHRVSSVDELFRELDS